jgi:16S rRNA (guanine527-N7)-methyltransferase
MATADDGMSARHPAPFGPEDLLVRGASALGLGLDSSQIQAFGLYREELIRWSARTNLTALREPEEIVREGFLDSLACLLFVPPEASRVLDIGSGAGFPAIPIKLTRPTLKVSLVEASRKKTTFLRHIVRSLDLQDVRVVQCRAEDLATDPAEQGKYDLAFARAVAPLSEQVRLVAPFLRPGGLFLAQAGFGPAWQEASIFAKEEDFEIAGEFVLHPILGRPDRRVLGLRRLQGRSAA